MTTRTRNTTGITKLYSLPVSNLVLVDAFMYIKLLAKSVLGIRGENHSHFFVGLVSRDSYFVRS